jgi:hypothetical protein
VALALVVGCTFDTSGAPVDPPDPADAARSGSLQRHEVITGGSSDSMQVGTSAPVPHVPGSQYLAMIATKSHTDITNVTDGAMTFAPLISQCAPDSQTGIDVWVASAPDAGAGAPVVAQLADAPTNAVIAVVRYSGVGRIASTASTNAADGSCVPTTETDSYNFSLTPASADGLVVIAAAIRGHTHEPVAPMVEITELAQGDEGGSTAAIAFSEQPVAGANPVVLAGTLDGETKWAAVAVELVP